MKQKMDIIEELLTRNIDKVYPSKKQLLAKLNSNEKLKIYLGIDPSSSKIHLGNAVILRKLKEFQNLGHKVILLIGDFTGMIGDPTDRNAVRKPLSREEVLANSADYQKQAEKILSFSGKNPAEIYYNSDWLSKMTFEDVVKLSGHFTVSQMLERDMFQERIKQNKPIGLHEFLYPIMQGYDSVSLNVDIEIGGSDQTFNMLVGRQLMQDLKKKEKFVITMPLLEGSDGRKMSKSYNNSIDISDNSVDMFGKIMSVKDDLILKYFELCTNVSNADLKTLSSRLQTENPIELKKELAREIVKLYHSEANAQEAEKEFENVVQNKERPSLIEELQFSKKLLPKPYHFFLSESGMVQSVSQAERLAKQGAIYFDEQKIDNVRDVFDTRKTEFFIKAGKRNFKKIVLK